MSEYLKKAREKQEAKKLIKEQSRKLKFDKLCLDLGLPRLKSEAEIRQEILDKRDTEYKSISLETKQKFIELMWSGKNVGQASKECNISSEMGAEILLRNRGEYFLREVKE